MDIDNDRIETVESAVRTLRDAFLEIVEDLDNQARETAKIRDTMDRVADLLEGKA